MECLYCSRQFAASALRTFTCPACWRRHEVEFGVDWHQADWHQALLPAARLMASDGGVTGLTDHEREVVHLVDAKHADREQALDVPLRVARRRPPIETTHRAVYQAVRNLYVEHHLGARRIFAALQAQHITPAVTLRTVKRYLARIKRECGLRHQKAA
jgi:hypothetical protein